MTLPDFLTEWPGNEIVLTGHRIGLYHVVTLYNGGYTAEMLVDYFDGPSLPLICKVLAFYLENRAEVDAYVAACQARIDRQRAEGRHIDTDVLLKRFAERYPERAQEIARVLGKADPTCH
jgi:uncharacterized protein (DUF433 family)